ncbi:hypothetical protein KVR01_013756 [Diaporthe batatas]|uniref:uncharacterized protein n=1 Tax=Diaporthe batatas TaxID=748121 RepID=UPI001D042364|nr:uncharacterized protein KVR01_013756 [Diaporthe batatas]KAG8156415.1 hypothetical protein KVR01_013756 [Diaporthe batatas]
MPHKNWAGLAVPTLSVETNDHTGGGVNYGGLHPTSIAALLGKGPEVKKGERFDFKFNINGSRSSAALVVNTTKHLPHVEWSSDGGLGKLPLAGATALAAKFFFQSTKGNLGQKKSLKNSESDRRQRDVAHIHSSSRTQPMSSSTSHRSSQKKGRKQGTRANSQSSRNTSPTSQCVTSRQSRVRSTESSHPHKRRKPIKEEQGYDSGYASGSDRNSVRCQNTPRPRTVTGSIPKKG